MRKSPAIIAVLLSLFVSSALSGNGNGDGRVTVSIGLPDSIAMDPARVSCAVTNGALPDGPDLSIAAEILLNSEIRGHIENPQYYFENINAGTDSDLDLLMMTQGWRRYESEVDLNDTAVRHFKFPVEQTQSISGHVEKSFNRHPKGMKLALFMPTTLEIMQFQLGDSSRFILSNLDFVDGTPFTLEAQTKDGGTRTTSIHIDDPVFPDVTPLKESARLSPVEDSTMQSFAEFTKKQPRAASLLDMQMLDEVKVTGRTTEKWGNRGNVEPHRGYKAGDEKIRRYPTMESLLRSLSVKIRYTETTGALPEPQFGEYIQNEFIATPVYIDGFRSEQSEAFIIIPDNVNSIEYFRPGDARVASYSPESLVAGLLLITTKYGNEGSRQPQPSMINFTPLGYQPPVEFYTPEYSGPQLPQPDYRATLYWNPAMELAPGKKAEVRLYPPHSTDSLDISVQGISPDGKLIDITRKIRIR